MISTILQTKMRVSEMTRSFGPQQHNIQYSQEVLTQRFSRKQWMPLVPVDDLQKFESSFVVTGRSQGKQRSPSPKKMNSFAQ